MNIPSNPFASWNAILLDIMFLPLRKCLPVRGNGPGVVDEGREIGDAVPDVGVSSDSFPLSDDDDEEDGFCSLFFFFACSFANFFASFSSL